MERKWVFLGRVLRPPVRVDAAAGGEGEAAADAGSDTEQAHGVAEVEAADAHGVAEVEAAAGAALAGGGLDEAAAPPVADLSIPLADPPRINIMSAAPTAHPFPEQHPDKAPYIVCVDSGCILLSFNVDVDPIKGVCFDDRPYHSSLIVVRDFSRAGVEQGHRITATAERIPQRDARQAAVTNVQSIGIINDLSYSEEYFIAELMIDNRHERATLLSFSAGPGRRHSSNWIQQSMGSPLPPLLLLCREWVPSGVVSYGKMLWWFDLSWGMISYDAQLETEDEEPVLLFHWLPEGHGHTAQRDMHDRRCIAVSAGSLRYVAITPHGDAATVTMWTLLACSYIHDDDVDGTGWSWDREFTVSFEEIWEHDSYKATGLPRKVPVLTAVCPSNAYIVYFAMEDPRRLFAVNMYSRRVEEFIDESFELLSPSTNDAPASCRYVLPWFLPLEVAQGEDPLACVWFREEQQVECKDKELIGHEELQEAEFEDKEQQQVAEIHWRTRSF